MRPAKEKTRNDGRENNEGLSDALEAKPSYPKVTHFTLPPLFSLAENCWMKVDACLCANVCVFHASQRCPHLAQCDFSFPFPSHLLQTDRINPDDIDLENEPWYKFFSELEFGRPVSEARLLI